MKRKILVIGSVLKPVDDVRHYHKLALSMAKTSKYEINIIGFKSKNQASHPNVAFYPIFSFRRISAGRFLAPFRFLWRLLKLTPELIMVNTPELLAVSVVYKILFGCKLIYDIQEDYCLNIRQLSPLPSLLKTPAAFWVRAAERLTSPWVDHFILAESSYKELPFIGLNATVIQNKTVRVATPGRVALSKERPRFLVSGTLSVNYGLKLAVEAFLAIKQEVPAATLLLCGKVHDSHSAKYIASMVESGKGIELTGGAEGVPHAKITEAMLKADAALVFYPPNPAIDECFPARIWECMACRLPMVIQRGRYWSTYVLEKKAGSVFSGTNTHTWWDSFCSTDFFPASISYHDIYWAVEEPKLLDVADRLLS